MERISVSTLRAGMVLPLLQIGDGSRDICCDIISGTGQSHTPIDNSIKEPDMRTSTPTVLKACSAPNSVVMADAHAEIPGTNMFATLRALNVP